MAICAFCKKEMSDDNTESCDKLTICFADGPNMVPSTFHFNEPNGRCHDCNIKHGGYHHPGCDVERCPRCNNQLITCNCTRG